MTPSPRTSQRFRIVVRGRLTARTTAAFEGLTSTPAVGSTSLEGEFADSAALHGALERLHGLGIDLISVNPTGAAGAPKE
jgi:hypothetical protein